MGMAGHLSSPPPDESGNGRLRWQSDWAAVNILLLPVRLPPVYSAPLSHSAGYNFYQLYTLTVKYCIGSSGS